MEETPDLIFTVFPGKMIVPNPALLIPGSGPLDCGGFSHPQLFWDFRLCFRLFSPLLAQLGRIYSFIPAHSMGCLGLSITRALWSAGGLSSSTRRE